MKRRWIKQERLCYEVRVNGVRVRTGLTAYNAMFHEKWLYGTRADLIEVVNSKTGRVVDKLEPVK